MKIKRLKKIMMLVLGGTAVLAVVLVALHMNQLGGKGVNADARIELNGKKVLFDGDSIAMGSVACGSAATTCGGNSSGKFSYADAIRTGYGTNNTNVSMGGARFYWPNYSTDSNCNHGQDCVISNHLTSTIKNTTYDYIILEGGTNDLHFYYRNNPEDYFAALRSYFDEVTSNPKWANAKIGFVIAPKFDYSRKTWYDHDLEAAFRGNTQEICDDYSIEYINFFKASENDGFVVPDGFRNWSFMDTVIESEADSDEIGSYDGLHPSKGAHEMMGNYIASWMAKLPKYKYTVSFNSNGSSLSGADDQMVVHGKKAVEPTYIIDPDETFEYWSREPSCDVPFSFDTSIDEDMTLYACWEEIPDETESFTLSINTNGGSGVISPVTCNTTTGSCNVVVPNNKPTRNKYKFLGYAESSDAREATIQPGDTIEMTADKTIYAIWVHQPEIVSFVVSADIDGVISATWEYSDETAEPLEYDFWAIDVATDESYSIASGDKEQSIATTFVQPENTTYMYTIDVVDIYRQSVGVSFTLTLYPGHTLAFDMNGGEGEVEEQFCRPDDDSGICTVGIPSTIPVKSDNHFLGWGEDSTGSVPDYQPGDTATLYADKTIYAVWADDSDDPADPDDPVGPDVPVDPDNPDEPVNPVDPVGPSGDEGDDLPVPNTAGSPDTGRNMSDKDGGLTGALPIMGLVAVVLLYICKRKGGHRKFEH